MKQREKDSRPDFEVGRSTIKYTVVTVMVTLMLKGGSSVFYNGPDMVID